MELNVIADESGEYVDRLEFTKAISDSLVEFFGDDKLVVKSIKTNAIVAEMPTDDGEGVMEQALNLDDDMELELKLLVYIIVGASQFTAPEVSFHLSNDSMGNFIIEGLSLGDFSGTMISTADEYQYTIKLGARYLFNLLRQNGIFSFKYAPDPKPNKLELVSASTMTAAQLFVDKFEDAGSFAMPTAGSVAQDQREKKVRVKRLKMDRATDPAGYRRRQMAARIRWRKYRAKYIRGMKLFNRSAEGKRLNKIRGMKVSLAAKNRQN